MNTLGLSEPVAGEWKNFFLRAEQSGDPWLIERANERDDADILVQYPQVIARAILLLRIATGAARLVATDAAWSNSAMEFWWNEIGLDACLWDDDARPAAVVDLWADVQQAIEDLEGWSRKSARPEMVKRTWISDNAAALMTLGGIERVGLWGLGL